MIKLFSQNSKFIWRGSFEDRILAKDALFKFSKNEGTWNTFDVYKALKLIHYADDDTYSRLLPLHENLEESFDTSSENTVPCPEGLAYFPFQTVVASRCKPDNILIADDMGVGKTIQAILVANYLGLRRILVVCPASLIIKWGREIIKWHMPNPGVGVVASSKHNLPGDKSLVLSYERARLMHRELMRLPKFDMLVFDEAHYLKNPDSKRTRALLMSDGAGKNERKSSPRSPLFSHARKRVLLSGTIIPNRANEVFNVASKCLPEGVLDKSDKYYWNFISQYCSFYQGDYGPVFTGTKNEWLLHNKLRGSGFMLRRKKRSVLPQLPDKAYNMIVFPQDSRTAKIIEKEKQFNVEEVLAQGGPSARFMPGSPEIVHEMGQAKAPLVVQYIKMILDGGVDKLLVGAWHIDVLDAIRRGLFSDDNLCGFITGSTPVTIRQQMVDKFQSDPDYRVMFGQLKAAGEGIDLTAASDVVLAETYWTPAVYNQFIDRIHRIGQKHSVNVHIPVVEGSVDAKVFSSALDKESSQSLILDGV